MQITTDNFRLIQNEGSFELISLKNQRDSLLITNKQLIEVIELLNCAFTVVSANG